MGKGWITPGRRPQPVPRAVRNYSAMGPFGTENLKPNIALFKIPVVLPPTVRVRRNIAPFKIPQIGPPHPQPWCRLRVASRQFQPNERAAQFAVAQFQVALVDLGEFQRNGEAEAMSRTLGIRSGATA